MARARPGAATLLPAHRQPAARAARAADNPALEALWQVVALIPRGQVCSYGEVARAAGLPGRARLTGYALRMAPRQLHLPWHRVVGAGGRIVFPRTSAAFREQVRRLRAEGVAVRNARVAPEALSELVAR